MIVLRPPASAAKVSPLPLPGQHEHPGGRTDPTPPGPIKPADRVSPGKLGRLLRPMTALAWRRRSGAISAVEREDSLTAQAFRPLLEDASQGPLPFRRVDLWQPR